jgi:hypothetical protein
MDSGTVTVFGILALVIIMLAWFFRHRLTVLLRGPLGFMLKLRASNDEEPPVVGASVTGSTARRGKISAHANPGETAMVKNSTAETDIDASTTSPPTSHPKAQPPKPPRG